MNTPVNHSLAILGEDGASVWEADLVEDGDPADPEAAAYRDYVPAWHGLSRDGEVEGTLIYANYGTKEDYDQVLAAGGDFAGKIVLVRYGGNFRGLKVGYIAACLLWVRLPHRRSTADPTSAGARRRGRAHLLGHARRRVRDRRERVRGVPPRARAQPDVGAARERAVHLRVPGRPDDAGRAGVRERDAHGGREHPQNPEPADLVGERAEAARGDWRRRRARADGQVERTQGQAGQPRCVVDGYPPFYYVRLF